MALNGVMLQSRHTGARTANAPSPHASPLAAINASAIRKSRPTSRKLALRSRKSTRILSPAWVAYGNGYHADLPTLGAFCCERGIKLVVDGIQDVGVLATPLAQLGVDALIAGGHKAQLSLTGAAERTLGPARIVAESLTSRPGIRDQYRSWAGTTSMLSARLLYPSQLPKFSPCGGYRPVDQASTYPKLLKSMALPTGIEPVFSD